MSSQVHAMMQFLSENWFHVAPILLAGLFGTVISLERFRALFLVYPLWGSNKFFEEVGNLILTDRVAEAILLCDRYNKRLAPQVVKTALMRAHQPESLIEQGLQIAMSEAHQKISRRTAFVATIANVATLLGLFGTIVGLIHSFEAVGSVSAQQKSALLAAGISTAMNATMLGLGVAIPCMVIFSILANKSNRLMTEVEQAAHRTLDYIRQRYYSADPKNAQKSHVMVQMPPAFKGIPGGKQAA